MHSTIKNSKYRSNCSEQEIRNNECGNTYKDAHSANTEVSEDPAHGCVEVEMDESVRNLLSSADKCTSALLDVTIIKPHESTLRAVETSTLRGVEVKNLITNLNKKKKEKIFINDILEDKSSNETIVRICRHNPRRRMQASSDMCYDNVRDRYRQKNKLHKTIKARNNVSSSAPVDTSERRHLCEYNHCYTPGMVQIAPMLGEIRESLRNVDARIARMKGMNVDNVSEDTASDDSPHNFRCGDHKKTHHVYATPRTYKDMNSIITCQSMNKNTGTPCLCDHCGIASLLSETQKRPIITAPVEHLNEMRRNKSGKKECPRHFERNPISNIPKKRTSECSNPINGDKGMPVCYAHLAERLKVLEERMDIQEERAVPKDYFKRIITKIISHFSPRTSHKNDNFPIRDSDSNSNDTEPRYKNNYSVNPLLINEDNNTRKLRDKAKNNENMKKLLTNLTEYLPENKKNEFAEHFWKWGGEILKPGIDLKNKILSLLDVTMQNPSKGNEGSERQIQHSKVTEQDKRRKSKKISSSNSLHDSKEFDSEAFKNFVEAMSAKIYQTHKKSLVLEEGRRNKESHKSSNQTVSDASSHAKIRKDETGAKNKNSTTPKSPSKSNSKPTKQHEANKKLNVSYLSPKLSTWQEEESQISFRLEFSDAETINSRTKDPREKELEKIEFLKTLSRTKDSDKEKLWESIWAQAKANGQTKQDKVTIQLPRKSDNSQFNDMIEIEFSIGEIEHMLTKHKYTKQESFVRDKNKSKS